MAQHGLGRELGTKWKPEKYELLFDMIVPLTG
jgi:hypothetical protein